MDTVHSIRTYHWNGCVWGNQGKVTKV